MMAFLHGFSYCLGFLHDIHFESLPGMRGIVEEYYNCYGSALNWPELILRHCESDEQAFDKFNELYEIYLNNISSEQNKTDDNK